MKQKAPLWKNPKAKPVLKLQKAPKANKSLAVNKVGTRAQFLPAASLPAQNSQFHGLLWFGSAQALAVTINP